TDFISSRQQNPKANASSSQIYIYFTAKHRLPGGAQAWTYNYSTGPNQRWLEARQWCQKHFTDMVGIQNREETEFLNKLLPSNPKYYWIGIHKVAGAWTWAGSNQNVPEEAQNWATSEPDNIAGQDCVEIYIKRETDSAKWNNEKCRNKKGTVCYADSCMQDSCSAHADCVETVGSFTCRCHPGFFGPRCDEATACKPLPDPAHGFQRCFHPFGSSRFNSSCFFGCELGFRLMSELPGNPFSLPVTAGQCPVLNHTSFSGGRMTCSHPVAPYSYNSTCEFRCDDGYELTGDARMHCDHSGQWTASVPACTGAVSFPLNCPAIISPATGSVTCVDAVEPFSFGSRCDFTCREGFYLTGDEALTCLASGRWSNATPTCTAVQCSRLKPPLHAHVQCKDPAAEHSYGSTCTVHCEDGFDLIGANVTTCSAQATWSHAPPDCRAKTCNPVQSPRHGSLSCSDPNAPFSFGSRCTETCDEGFLLNGTSSFECTSQGRWSADMPSCLARQCPLLAEAPRHGRMTCSHPDSPFSYGSVCSFECSEGFRLREAPAMTCNASGLWSQTPAGCQREPPLDPPHPPAACLHCCKLMV
uniref:E-selectin n=1 Tax=Stegastes partitus TaxID=144197 RepID=A0A3B5A1K3_9TELE